MMTKDHEAKLSMFMRVLSVLEKNEKEIKDNQPLMEARAELKQNIERIFSTLTEEERDRMLERYKNEMEYLGLNK